MVDLIQGFEHGPADEVRTHWQTCFHSSGGFELIRDAEQVAVFDEVGTHRIHISVCVEGWYSCQWIGEVTWHEWTQVELLEYVSTRIKNLQQLMHRPQ